MLVRCFCGQPRRLISSPHNGLRSRAVLWMVINRIQIRSTSGIISQLEGIHVENDDDARLLVASLSSDERRRLQVALGELEKQVSVGQPSTARRLTKGQMRQLFLVNAIPFIGFGFLDNVIMIIAGEYIDQSIGAWLTLSTMAAAALGNTVSDAAGVGLTHYVEFLVSRFGIKHPVLNSEQTGELFHQYWLEPVVKSLYLPHDVAEIRGERIELESSLARWVINIGRGLGLILGCLIGMFPLLFFDSKKDKEELVKKTN